MSVGAATATSTSPDSKTLDLALSRERPLAVIVASAVTGLAALALFHGRTEVLEVLATAPLELLLWIAIVVVVNLFPVNFGEMRLCLDMPVLMAVALIYDPATSAFVAAIAAVDRRELRAKIALSHALFNRAQVSLSAYMASAVFHTVAGDIYAWPTAISGTALAVIISYGANVLLVTTYTSIQLRMGPHESVRLLRPAVALPILGTYLGYGALGLVLGRLFFDVGPWAVVAFLLPILVARGMFIRAQRVEVLAQELRERERLLEGLLDRVVDERRDERLRISGDLHDDVLQALTHVRLLGNVLKRDMPLPSDVQRDIDTLVASADEAIAALRRVMSDLRNSPLGRGGLISTLRGTVQDLQLDWQIPIRLEVEPIRDLSPHVQVVLYQVAREALINALKHAHPSAVSVDLRFREGSIRLEVSDDGKGFDVGSQAGGAHLGLTLMRERVSRVNGTLDVTSSQNKGTAVVAAVPAN